MTRDDAPPEDASALEDVLELLTSHIEPGRGLAEISHDTCQEDRWGRK